ncbi:MAG: flagellar biosynthesis protein FlhB [Phycisphaerales bacterium]|nr:flagellar biosynthesis protein FlhB [Phycisphaerales bacterium]
MADDAGERTEAPTPRRRQESRERGQVAKSTDLSSALLLFGGLLALRLFAPRLASSLLKVLRENLAVEDPSAFASVDVVSVVSSAGMLALSAAGPILFMVLLLALISNLLQVGFLFTLNPLTPKLDKLNPINGITRLFSTRTLIQFVMNILKLIVVTFVAYFAIKNRMSHVMLALAVDGWQQVLLFSSVLYDIGLQLAAALLVLALLDFAWQRYKHERDLRMSKQEVKEEMRRMEGDPIVKQRRRKMQFAAAMQQIQTAVPTADVVVTNPTELAVAIKYDAGAMQAPKVVAKGADYLAKKIREVAMLHGVPIVERKPLAQALYKAVEVGQEVPEQFYKAIAEILAYVYQLSGKSAAKKAAAPAA